MSNLPGKITDPHLSAEEPLTFRRCLRFILQALLLAFGCAAIIRIIGILSLFYYNKFWLEAQHPAGLLSISCLRYNKGSNWLTARFLGFYVRQ